MNIIFKLSRYITFLFYNTKISDSNAESGKVPECLQRFHVEWQGKSSPDSAIKINNKITQLTD
jgi:hypothetical protein